MAFRHRISASLLVVAVALCACSDDSGDSKSAGPATPPPAPAPPKPMVTGLNYAVANLAYQVAGDEIRVVYPVPAETDPARWKPDGGKIAAMRKAQLHLVVEGGEPPWLKQVAEGQEAKVVRISLERDFAAGFDPTQAIELTRSIAEQLGKVATDAGGSTDRIDSRAEALIRKLTDMDKRWRTAAARLKTGELAAVSKDLARWAATYGAPLVLVDERTQLGQEKSTPVHLLFPKLPGTALKSEMKVRGVEVVGLDPGNSRPASGDLLALLEANLQTLSRFVDPASTASAGTAPSGPSSAGGSGHGFEDGIVPLIEKYCLECHDAQTGEGEIDFEIYLTEKAAILEPDLWESVSALLEMKEMPPRKEKTQPSEEERQQFIAWIKALSERWDKGEMGRSAGHTTVRRLNKNEYNYTVRDLFGVRLRPADNFPEDGGGEAGFDNNADALFLPSLLMENYVEAAGGIVQAIYGDRNALGRYLFVRPSTELPAPKAARRVLKYWATRAYRRPVSDDELQRLMAIFNREIAAKKPYSVAMRMPLLTILISPNFLYRAEEEKPDTKPYAVENYDLASRLSYFLWSSMPDDQLLELAASGELGEPAVFEAQVGRMLDDEKARSLALHFAGQWLGWEELRSRANPDQKRYPSFTFDLRVALYQESAAFFGHLVSTNASAYDMLDCDYTFLNEQLARHYRIPGVTGSQLRKVSVTDPNRGGVIGMGSVLTATSLPLRSSPAKRGAYVLTELLGTPPPEPPMDVEQLPDDDREIETRTFREALVQHREDINCKACHEVLDPIGFGLENYDAIGRWRTEQNGAPLDSSGVMPDGTAFSTPADLKQRLMDNKELFARNFVEKLLSYALGRELTPYDRPAVRSITDRLIADDGRIRTAFLEVARSYPFRYRSNAGSPPVSIAGD